MYHCQRHRLTVESLNDALLPMWNAKLFLASDRSQLERTFQIKGRRGSGGSASGAADDEVEEVAADCCGGC